jgi:tRNA-splicing ligase RtcB
MSLKQTALWNKEKRYYEFSQGCNIPARLFLNKKLFTDCEESIFSQIQNACNYPGVDDVVVTPDVHVGYVVPVGTVMSTTGTLCQAPVGFDIGCGILCFRSDVDVERGMNEKLKLKFSQAVIAGIGLGAGHGGGALGYSRAKAEREFIPVDDAWDVPKNNAHRILERGMNQLGSLGGGNHFAEIQHDQFGKLWVMVHTGSRGRADSSGSARLPAVCRRRV